MHIKSRWGMRRNAGLMELILVMAFSVPAAAVQEGVHVHEGPLNEEYKVGKNGDVKINQDVTIGEVLVKKGKYLLTHRAEGENHLVVLTRINLKDSTEAPVHEIRTRFLPSTETVKRSALLAFPITDGSYQVPIIRIMGENGDHIPEKESK